MDSLVWFTNSYLYADMLYTPGVKYTSKYPVSLDFTDLNCAVLSSTSFDGVKSIVTLSRALLL